MSKEKFHVLKGTNFGLYNKERQLWKNILNRAKQGKIKICDNFHDVQYFVTLIRKLPNYKEWLNSNKKYGFNSDTDEYNEDTVYFSIYYSSCKKYARVHKRTRKVEYFNSQSELIDTTGYCDLTLAKYRKLEEPLDGYYICYADDVYKFI